MSKKNIISKVNVGNKVQVTFDADDGQRTYEYVGSSARALKRGTDPADLSGRLILHKKSEK
jgi:multidrug resistance efflux pump